MDKISWRFDIDSLTCIEDGLPNLLTLANRYDVKMTIYLNIGYSIDRSLLIRGLFTKSLPKENSPVDPAKFALRKKLGAKNYVRTILMNPQLMETSRARRNIDQALKDGHEIGMHGADNHGTWLRCVDQFSEGDLDDMFDRSYEEFCRQVAKPFTFAAPGFHTTDLVKQKLKRLGFTSHGDEYGSGKTAYTDAQGLQVRPVTIIGEGSVPIIEQMLALRKSPEIIRSTIDQQIEANSYRIIYGHPYFEGRHPVALAIVEQVMKKYAGS